MQTSIVLRVQQARVSLSSILIKNYERLTVAIIVAVGIALRLWSPAMRSDLWYDEVFTYKVAQKPFGEMMHTLFLGADASPPLYTLLLHYWFKLGLSDLHIQLFSLSFGAASIVVIYKLAKLIGGRHIGVLSCLLLATNNSAITYSVEARPYALFLFLSTLSTYFFLLIIREGGAKEDHTTGLKGIWFGYCATTTLVIYSHWFGLLLLPIHAVGLLIYCSRSMSIIRRYAVALIVIAFCCIPLLPFLYNQLRIQNAVGGLNWPGNSNWHSAANIAYFLSGGKALLPVVAVILVAGYLSKGKQVINRKLTRRHIVFFIVYLFIPVIIAGAVSLLLSHYSFLVPRYFLPFIIGVQILLALSLATFDRRIAAGLVLVFLLFPINKSLRRLQVPEVPYSSVASQLPSGSQSTLLIAHLSPMSYFPVRHYRRSHATEKVLWCESVGYGYVVAYNLEGEILDADDMVELDTALQKYDELWVVVDPIDSDPKIKNLWECVSSNPRLSLISKEYFGALRLEKYKIEPPEG